MRGILKPTNLLNYSQLTHQQRTQFQIHKQLGLAIVEIAEILGVHFSTLYREIQRNRQRGGEYDSFTAQEKALARRRIPRRVSQCTAENEKWVDQQIDKDLSPDVIAGRAKVTGASRRLSAGTIYKIIEKNRRNGGQMYRKLPRQGRKYRKNRTGQPGKGKLKVREGQELVDRPQGINERREAGHVEIDLMFSGETIWLTCVDRYTRFLRMKALPSKASGPIAEEVYAWLGSGKIRSITTDRGLEWSDLNPWLVDLLKKRLSLFFCQPYSSWEKGAIENMNRLLRRYLPKGKNIPWSTGNEVKAQQIEDVMNRKPRKILGYRTPDEVEKEWDPTRRRRSWKETMAVNPVVAA